MSQTISIDKDNGKNGTNGVSKVMEREMAKEMGKAIAEVKDEIQAKVLDKVDETLDAAMSAQVQISMEQLAKIHLMQLTRTIGQIYAARARAKGLLPSK